MLSWSEEDMADDDKTPKPEKPKRKELQVVPHPAEEEDISADMSELFDEEIVRHEHGRAEPEAD